MYRRPAVTVIQEFAGLVPALAAFNLPCVCVGPAYQLVTNASFGNYSGTQTDYSYAGLIPGAQVDLEVLAEDEQFPITKKPVSVKLTDAEIEVVSSSAVGVGANTTFTDATVGQFADVEAGDLVVIEEVTGITIVAAQTDGVSSDTPTLRDRLTSGVAGQFADVKVGDSVVVTGGTNTNTGTFTVTVKISSSVIKLDSDVNDGGGPSTDVAYSITGNRGTNNAGQYRVQTVVDDNTLTLEAPLVEDEAPITYYIKREVSEIELERDTDYTASASAITINTGLTHLTFPILTGVVVASYRALRNDLAGNIVEYGRLSDVQSFFGIEQITPANPLAYALSIMLQNTTTPVNGLGLDGNAVSNETLSYQNALDILGQTEMYAIVPLTQNPAIHQILKTHVEGFSQPESRRERIAFVNRRIITESIVQEEAETSTSLVGARIIVNTQLDGEALVASDTVLNDATSNAFFSVQPGDSVTIVGGTDTIPGTYTVVTKNTDNQLTLSGSIVTGNSTDIQYYIQRKDGLEADGITFYDRNTSFVADGIVAGYYLRFTAGPLTGTARISQVISDKKLLVDQIAGVVSVESGVTYEIYRDLTKTEQAELLRDYSAAVGSRRIVHVWPDVVKAPVGQTVEDVPGFYAACAPAAMTTGLPTQQGFTNLTISGFLGFENSSRYFTEAQLDTIADGGTLILAQEGSDQPLYVRHQLTTDRSSIKFQELSVTKNVDFIAKFIRRTYSPYIGVYNIVESTLDELRTTAKSIITFLKDDTRLPRIGGVIRNGQLTLLQEHETQIDTVVMRFKLDIPIPLNNLDITIEV